MCGFLTRKVQNLYLLVKFFKIQSILFILSIFFSFIKFFQNFVKFLKIGSSDAHMPNWPHRHHTPCLGSQHWACTGIKRNNLRKATFPPLFLHSLFVGVTFLPIQPLTMHIVIGCFLILVASLDHVLPPLGTRRMVRIGWWWWRQLAAFAPPVLTPS